MNQSFKSDLHHTRHASDMLAKKRSQNDRLDKNRLYQTNLKNMDKQLSEANERPTEIQLSGL